MPRPTGERSATALDRFDSSAGDLALARGLEDVGDRSGSPSSSQGLKAYLGSQLAQRFSTEKHLLPPDVPWALPSGLRRARGAAQIPADGTPRSGRRAQRWTVHDGKSFAANMLADQPGEPEERRLRELVGEMSDYSDYTRVKKLGSGAFGVAVLLRGEGDAIAAKRVKLQGASEALLTQLEMEVQTMRAMHHHNVVAYLGSYLADGTLVILQEYAAGGALALHIRYRDLSTHHFTAAQVARLLSELAAALDYVHSQGVLHRDLSSANVFLTGQGSVRLGDFGLATRGPTARQKCGTPYYLSPEEVRGEAYGAAADVWAFGVVAFEVLTLRRPFAASSMDELQGQILAADYDDARLAESPHPEALTELVGRDALLHPDPNSRLTLSRLSCRLEAAAFPSPPEPIAWNDVAPLADARPSNALGAALAAAQSTDGDAARPPIPPSNTATDSRRASASEVAAMVAGSAHARRGGTCAAARLARGGGGGCKSPAGLSPINPTGAARRTNTMSTESDSESPPALDAAERTSSRSDSSIYAPPFSPAVPRMDSSCFRMSALMFDMSIA